MKLDPNGLYVDINARTGKEYVCSGVEVDARLHDYLFGMIDSGHELALPLVLPYILAGEKIKCCEIVEFLFEKFSGLGAFVRLEGPVKPTALQAELPGPAKFVRTTHRNAPGIH